MNDRSDQALRLLLFVAVASIVIGGSIDLALDQPRDWFSFHVIFETMMIAGALVMAVTLWLGWWNASRSVGALRTQLEAQSREREAWRKRARQSLAGMAVAIDGQFREWRLTPAERDVALLLLKGLGHKEAAVLTGRSERTVRQHAVAVYEKAGVSGRAELAAFFLGDLELPAEEARNVATTT